MKPPIHLKSWLFAGFVGMTTLFLLVPPAMSQEGTTATPVEVAAEPELKPLPVSEIASSIAETQLRISEIEEGISPQVNVEEFDSGLDGFDQEYEASLRQLNSLSLDIYSLRALEETRQQWQTMSQAVSKWERMIAERLRNLEEFEAELRDIHELWELTTNSAREENLPDGVIEANVLEALDRDRKRPS